jgi:hypothetical protein
MHTDPDNSELALRHDSALLARQPVCGRLHGQAGTVPPRGASLCLLFTSSTFE